MFDRFTITYEREVPTSELADFVDSLTPYTYAVTLRRLNFRTAAGGIGTLEAAVMFAIALTSSGFLKEVGADLYKETKAALLGLYRKLTQLNTPSGRFQPLGVTVAGDGFDARFIFTEGLTDDEFMASFSQIPDVARSLAVELGPGDPEWRAIVEYERDADGSWVKRFHEGIPHRPNDEV